MKEILKVFKVLNENIIPFFRDNIDKDKLIKVFVLLLFVVNLLMFGSFYKMYQRSNKLNIILVKVNEYKNQIKELKKRQGLYGTVDEVTYGDIKEIVIENRYKNFKKNISIQLEVPTLVTIIRHKDEYSVYKNESQLVIEIIKPNSLINQDMPRLPDRYKIIKKYDIKNKNQ